MRGSLKGRSFVSMRDLSNNELAEALATAADLKRMARAGIPHASLQGKVLGMLFQKPSLRTRASFEVAMAHLGGQTVYLSPAEVGMGQREAVDDVAMVVSRYFDIVVSRVFGHDIIESLAEHASVPVINALSDGEHPCQILADLLTVQEWRGDLKGQTLSYVGDGNNVAVSLAYGCAKVGMHFNIAAPEGYQLSQDVIDAFHEEAKPTGATFFQTTDPREAAKDAHVIYTDVWTSMGQEAEREKRLKAFEGYLVDDALVALGDDPIVLHCLPAHYGEEITRGVSRSPRSAIWDQAENRLHAHKALLTLLA
jgi:ornithine carbamoyltransferase